MTAPTTCRLWTDPEAYLSGAWYDRLPVEKTVEDDGKFLVETRRCKACGQLWWREFEEEKVGWDEAWFVTFVPVEGPGHLAALRMTPRPLDRSALPACIVRDTPLEGGAGPARRHWKGA